MFRYICGISVWSKPSKYILTFKKICKCTLKPRLKTFRHRVRFVLSRKMDLLTLSVALYLCHSYQIKSSFDSGHDYFIVMRRKPTGKSQSLFWLNVASLSSYHRTTVSTKLTRKRGIKKCNKLHVANQEEFKTRSKYLSDENSNDIHLYTARKGHWLSHWHKLHALPDVIFQTI